MKVDESNFDTLEKVTEITDTEYNIRWFDAENIDGYIECDDLYDMVYNLVSEVNHLKEQLKEQEDYCTQYHTMKCNPNEDYDINENLFH